MHCGMHSVPFQSHNFAFRNKPYCTKKKRKKEEGKEKKRKEKKRKERRKKKKLITQTMNDFNLSAKSD